MSFDSLYSALWMDIELFLDLVLIMYILCKRKIQKLKASSFRILSA